MKKFTLIILGTLLSVQFVLAGGLVHNTNQSATWARMLSRGASVDIDAVYFNPAGLTKLGDGFHISLSSQSIFQEQTITSSFPFLNESKYTGSISAPVFPSVYLAYKTGKFVFSFGFLPLGGGGGATFSKGVPMMETPISTLVPMFGGAGVNGYSVDMEFKGTSVYWGIQAGVSYEINEHISVFAGARYIMAKNTYEGHIRDITLNRPAEAGGPIRADDFLNGLSASAKGAGDSMEPIIAGGGGALTWDQAVAMGVLTPEQSAGLQGGLLQFGFSQEQVDAMNMEQAQGSYYGTSTKLGANATLMADQVGDITQTGSGITPIVGVNLSFMEEKLNIGLKYEFQTKLDLTNDVPVGKGFLTGYADDGTPIYMYPDKEVTNADIPAMLSIGADYRVIDPLKVSVTFHSYFDKSTTWAKDANPSTIDKNFWELAVGVEYDITEKFLLSTGYLRAQTGVTEYYQSNLSFSLSTNTFAFGGAYKINDMFKVNLGAYYTMYDKGYKDRTYESFNPPINYEESYLKSTFAVAIGVDITIGSKK